MDTCGLNLETVALSSLHFIDDRFRPRIAALARRQRVHNGSPGREHYLADGTPATWVGAPRTTRTRVGSHLGFNQDTHSALGLSFCAWSASRLTAEFSGRGLTCQHAGARRLPERRQLSPAAMHFMVHGPLQRFVRRHGAKKVVRVARRGLWSFYSHGES
jgi:hypothetical protein